MNIEEKNGETLLQEPIVVDAISENDKPGKPGGTFPSLVDLLVFLGIFVVAQSFGAVVGWAVAGWPDSSALESADEAIKAAAEISISQFNAVSYFVAMLLTLVGFLYYRRRRGGPRIIARFSLRGLNPILLLWGVVFMLSTSVVLEPVLALLPAAPNVYGRGVWALVTLVVMAPVFEEVIFRGVLLESTRLKYGVISAWLLSSLVFGVVHMHPAIVVSAFAGGLVLGFIYIQSGSLWAAVILHAINNAIAYLALVTGFGNTMLIEMVGNRSLYIAIYLVGFAVFAVSGYMVYRTLARMKEAEKKSVEA